jgi:CPA1 family monovalent cation:H+ antiporter
VDGRAQQFLSVGAAVLVTVIAVRLAWVMLYFLYLRFILRKDLDDQSRIMPTARGAFIVGWCGMRGIVTLATALALPFSVNGAPFPYRDLLVASAFGVVIGSLLLQGLTLGPILKRFKLSDDGTVAREEVFAREEITRAALTSLDGESRPEASILRKEYHYRLPEGNRPEEALKPHHVGRLRLRAIQAERVALSQLRSEHKIGDAAFQTVQEELDWAEGHAAHRKRAFSAVAPDPVRDASEAAADRPEGGASA